MIKKQESYKSIRYLVYYPDNFNPSKQYPLFFHLHGAGSRGNNFEEFAGSTILNMLEKGDVPLCQAICVFPQCHVDTWFDIFGELLELVKKLHDLSYVDKEKFIGSGISMGGYAIYQVMMSLSEMFTKGFVCCGGGMYWNSGKIKDIKFRIFHGQLDTAVYPEESIRMYNRLKEACADVLLTIYPECDHNCWDKAYTDLDNQKWIVE